MGSEMDPHATLYASYYNTTDPDLKKEFFSTDCCQICRPVPSYAANNRKTIVTYLKESGEQLKHLFSTAPDKEGKYTIRPLKGEEKQDFGTDEHVKQAGFASVEEVREKALREGWVGMRVDLWEDDGMNGGMLVKVQYWWRREEDGRGLVWRQIFHDIMYLGKVDGSEGKMTAVEG